MLIYFNQPQQDTFSFIAFLSEVEEHQAHQAFLPFVLDTGVNNFEMYDREDLVEVYLQVTDNQYTVYYDTDNLIVIFSNVNNAFQQETTIDELAERIIKGRLGGIEGFNNWHLLSDNHL